ncbi:MAG: bifunctional 5,10-methylenetetrahydrofolate dehydrogenase/5,10-methenyltetrahydrofolate cyclohydrolase [Candidatus Paceibacterota bacterium]|jgi:methylenetetrahydrofolate dehydrogenase (NADP+)/methenyltetrahydrofolate cyclohydrolase
MQIIDGKKIRDEILEKVKQEVSSLSFQPIFCDVLVGDDLASKQYVQMKGRTAEIVGIAFHTANFLSSINTNELIKEIEALNKMPNMCGIIIQLPLPSHIDRQAVLDAIDQKLDVDCLGTIASQKFYNNYDKKNDLAFPTALASLAVLDSLNFDNNPSTALRTRKIVVLGQGMLVGKPVTALLRSRNLSPFTVDSKTTNKEELIKDADIIISGLGKGGYITGNLIKKGAILIDAGTFETEGGIIGDVDLESVKDIAGYVSPVPGGVGPVTVAMLLNNVLTVAKSLPPPQG